MGYPAGMSVNIITVAWLVFAIVFFSFPFEMPVKGIPSIPFFYILTLRHSIDKIAASNMNYTCACVGGFLIIELLWWIIAGRKYTKSMQKARQEEENAARAMMVNTDEK